MRVRSGGELHVTVSQDSLNAMDVNAGAKYSASNATSRVPRCTDLANSKRSLLLYDRRALLLKGREARMVVSQFEMHPKRNAIVASKPKTERMA